MVDTRPHSEVALVYNRLSTASVLAAAIYYSELLKSAKEGVKVYDVSQLVPDDAERYVWIGVNPKKHIGAFYHKVSDKDHVVIIDPEPTEPEWLQLHPFKTKYKKEEEIDNSDHLFYPETLVMQVCKHLQLEELAYRPLDLHLSRFYDTKADMVFLAFVYANLLDAQASLANHTGFMVRGIDKADIEKYLDDMREVKRKLTAAHVHGKFQNGYQVCPAVQLSFQDFSIHLAVRLTRLVHKYFINMAMGMSGAIAYTNMRHIVFENDMATPLVVN